MKKRGLFVSVLLLCVFICLIFLKLSFYNQQEDQEAEISQILDIDISEAMADTQKYGNVSIINHETLNNFLSDLCKEEHLNFIEKVNMTVSACCESNREQVYLIIKQTVKMTEDYQYTLCFYVTAISQSACQLNSVVGAYVDGDEKIFSGDLFYILESKSKLSWRINGDFYNNGDYIVLENLSSEIGIDGRVNYKGIHAENHFGYQFVSGSFYSH